MSQLSSARTEYLALLAELDRRRRANQLAAYKPYLTLPVVQYSRATGLPLANDDTTTLAAAFLIGVCAMWISDILFEVIVRKFRPAPEE
ncbi:hypothetical protein [Mesorhizobium sp. B2-4-15]|uniref:hypothetical protein n=1 Tax=Mesorhizobium sp. B2-4-15 TaxID=2589934 RepID=UPI001FEDA601|nr:hypothetical protein [Mesorhizobium sp. B2-4-15]